MEPSAQTADLDRLLRHSEWLGRLARRLVGDASTADDLVQETFLAALKNPPDPLRPARPWLAGVMRNLVKLRARTEERRRRRQERAAKRDELPSTAQLLETVDTGRRLAEEVVALAEPYRTTMLLHYYQELSAAEISRRQGIPAGTVRWRIKRGLEELRLRLDRAWPDRKSWCVALGPLAREAERGGGLIGPTLVPTSLLTAGVWKGAFALFLLGLFGWLGIWLGRDVTGPGAARAAGLSVPDAVADEREGRALAGARIGQESDRTASSPLAPPEPRRLHLVLHEHDDRPAASWRGVLARGGGAAEPFVLDQHGAVDLPAPGEPVDLFLARPNAHVLHLELEPGAGERLLRLPRGREVAGRVLVSGRPPESPLVVALSTDRPLHHELLERLGLQLNTFHRALERGRRTRATSTAGGAFRFHGLGADWSGLVLLPEGYRLAGDRVRDYDGPGVQLYDGEVVGPTVHFGGPTSGVVIELEPLPRVRGRVVDAELGAPLVGALYRVRFETDLGLIQPKQPLPCGPEGEFEAWFPGVGTRAATVEVWDANGRRGRELSLGPELLTADVELGDLALTPGVALTLQVIDEDERPIAGARASCEGLIEPSAASGADGSLALSGLPEEASELLVSAPGRLGRRVPIEPDHGESQVVQLELANRLVVQTRGPSVGLSLRLSAKQGPFAGVGVRPDPVACSALRKAQISAEVDSSGSHARFRVPASGELVMTGLEPRTPMQLELLDRLGEVVGVHELAPLGPAEERQVSLAPELPVADLVGRVRVEGVGVLVGVVVTLTSPDGGVASQRTGQSGEFLFRGIAAEQVDVEVAKPGFVSAQLSDQPIGPGQLPLDVLLERGLALRIEVVDANGLPVEGAEASATRADDPRTWSSREREPGRLEIPDVPASRELRVELHARGRTVVRQHDPLAGELRIEWPQ